MEYQVNWTPNAIKCVHEIGNYIKRKDSEVNASKVVSRIQKRAGRLKSFPESGRVIPEHPELGYYDVVVVKKRIIYEICGFNVNVVAVVDTRIEDNFDLWLCLDDG